MVAGRFFAVAIFSCVLSGLRCDCANAQVPSPIDCVSPDGDTDDRDYFIEAEPRGSSTVSTYTHAVTTNTSSPGMFASSTPFPASTPTYSPASFPTVSPTPGVAPSVAPTAGPAPAFSPVSSQTIALKVQPTPNSPVNTGPGICAYLGGFYPPEQPYLNQPGPLVDSLSLCLSWELNVFPTLVNGRSYTMSPLPGLPPDAHPLDVATQATNYLNPWPSQCTEPCGFYRTRSEARAHGANFDVIGFGRTRTCDEGVECVLSTVGQDFTRMSLAPEVHQVTCLVREPYANECADQLASAVGDFPILRAPLQAAISEYPVQDPDVFYSMLNGIVFPAIIDGESGIASCKQVIMTRSRLESATTGYRPFYTSVLETLATSTGETPLVSCKDKASADWWRTRTAIVPRPDSLRSKANAACMVVGQAFGVGMGSGMVCNPPATGVAR